MIGNWQRLNEENEDSEDEDGESADDDEEEEGERSHVGEDIMYDYIIVGA